MLQPVTARGRRPLLLAGVLAVVLIALSASFVFVMGGMGYSLDDLPFTAHAVQMQAQHAASDNGVTIQVTGVTATAKTINAELLLQDDDAGLLTEHMLGDWQASYPGMPSGSGSVAVGAHGLRYDAERKGYTVTLSIREQNENNRYVKLNPDRLSIKLTTLKVMGSAHTNHTASITPDLVTDAPETRESVISAWGYADNYPHAVRLRGRSGESPYFGIYDGAKTLAPGTLNLPLGDAAHIVAAGWMDNGLHILCRADAEDENITSAGVTGTPGLAFTTEDGTLYAPDREGSACSLGYTDEEGTTYWELICDVKPDDFQSGVFTFSTLDESGVPDLTGDWNVSFNLA